MLQGNFADSRRGTTSVRAVQGFSFFAIVRIAEEFLTRDIIKDNYRGQDQWPNYSWLGLRGEARAQVAY